MGHPYERGFGIEFAAFLAQAGGVDFEGDPGVPERLDGGFVKAAQITFGPVIEFLWKIGMRDKIKEAAADALCIGCPIAFPDRLRGARVTADIFGMIDFPAFGKIMHTADQKIPFRQGGKLFDPCFPARQIVAFQSKPDDELGKAGARLGHGVEVAGEFGEAHAPVVEIFGHWIMISEPDLLESELEGAFGKFHGPAAGMRAKRSMEVIIGERIKKHAGRTLKGGKAACGA